MKNKVYIHLPDHAKQGELVFVRVKIDHEMQPGWQATQEGKIIPQNIVTVFSCLYNGREVFKADFEAGMAPNPYLGFYVRATESGTIDCAWETQDGEVHTTSSNLTVT